MYKIIYYIGKNDKDTGKQTLSNEFFISTINKILGECTIIRAKGLYFDTKGRQIHKPSLVVIKFDNDNGVSNIPYNVKQFKKLFNQECILVEKQEINTEVY